MVFAINNNGGHLGYTSKHQCKWPSFSSIDCRVHEYQSGSKHTQRITIILIGGGGIISYLATNLPSDIYYTLNDSVYNTEVIDVY